MPRPAVVIVLAMVTVSIAGCGTSSDAMCGPIGEGPRFYRGVWTDAQAVRQFSPLACPLFVADMPLSAVADTLLIPDTIIYNRHPEAPPGHWADQGKDAEPGTGQQGGAPDKDRVLQQSAPIGSGPVAPNR
jgi:uncharacterized protein YceK